MDSHVAMGTINTLAATTAAGRAVEKGGFMARAFRELSDSLCGGNGSRYRSSLSVSARASGSAFMAETIDATADGS